MVRCPKPDISEITSRLTALGAAPSEAEAYAKMSGRDTGRAERLYNDEQYRAMRAELYGAFVSALRGSPDYKFAKQKCERSDWAECCELLLLYAHDLLCAACGLEPEHWPDRAAETKKLVLHFTIADIGCIIDFVTEAAMRTSTNAAGGAVFDRLFSQIAELALAKRTGQGH